jgi:hypothetical protein
MPAVEMMMVERFTMLSPKSFEDTLSKLQAAIDHPDMSAFSRELARHHDQLPDTLRQSSSVEDCARSGRKNPVALGDSGPLNRKLGPPTLPVSTD